MSYGRRRQRSEAPPGRREPDIPIGGSSYAGRVHVVATAGHVDHGKSTLLRALTGQEPDRWEAERARGLSIDLGFVWTPLAAGNAEPMTVSFVDVPGHERFIANMLAGAGGVGLALFVVAADDGWSAQSQEHLDILDLLGVAGAVAAVTKVSTVAVERADEVAADVAARLRASTLGEVPVVRTDAVAGQGVDELRAVLANRLAAAHPAADHGRARLWVDRSFTISGAGTVVTGTLAGGVLSTGGDVSLLPAGGPARVRGLESLGSPVTTALPGSRTAVNLAGVDRDDARRGQALVADAADWVVTRTVDAWVRALPGHSIDRPGAWHLHVGSAETLVSVHPLLSDPVRDDAPGWVRLRLADAVALQVGDRFVLREAGRRATAGGGQVVDPQPPGRVRGADQRLARAGELDAIRAASTPGALVAALVDAWGGARPAAATLAAAGVAGGKDDASAGAAGRKGDASAGVVGRFDTESTGLTRIAGWLVQPAVQEGWSDAVEAELRAEHDARPTSPGLDRTALARVAVAAGCPHPRLAAALADHLVELGRLRRQGATYALAGHAGVVDDAREQRRARLLGLLAADALAPPDLGAAAREARIGYPEVQALVQGGEIVRCGKLAFTREAIDEAARRLRALHATTGPFTASEAKDAWATTRKYAIPLLEHFDATGLTIFDGTRRRVADQRRAGPSAPVENIRP